MCALRAPREPAAELDGQVDERAHVVVGRPVVDDARPQADLARRPARARSRRRRRPAAPATSRRCARRGRRRRPARGGRGRPRAAARRTGARDRRGARARRAGASPGRGSARSRRGIAAAPCARKASQSFRARNGRGVLERDVDHVVARAARAGCSPPRARGRRGGPRAGGRARRRRPSAGRATCARRASPSRRDRGRRRGAGGRRRRGGDAVGAVDVEPDVPRLADVGERRRCGSTAPVSVVPAVAMTATGAMPAARSASIASATASGTSRRSSSSGSARTSRRRARAARRRERRSSAPRSSSRRAPRRPPMPSRREPGKRPLARGGERRDVRDRPAARERPGRGREADELADPADGLILDLRRGARPDREVDVEARREQVAEDADLEPRRADEREEARPGLRDRDVEHARRVVERRQGARALLRERGAEERLEALVDLGLARARLVEAPPRIRDDRRGARRAPPRARRRGGATGSSEALLTARSSQEPTSDDAASRSRAARRRRAPRPARPSASRPTWRPVLVVPLDGGLRPTDLREAALPISLHQYGQPVELAVDPAIASAARSPHPDRHVPVREHDRAEAACGTTTRSPTAWTALEAGKPQRGVDVQRQSRAPRGRARAARPAARPSPRRRRRR